MADLKELQQKIDIKIVELRQQAHFAINKYDYHHKNDEFEILEQQIEILNQVSGTYTRFLNEMQKFNQTLNDAKNKSAQLDQLLIESQPTTQQEQIEDHHQLEHQHQQLQPPNGRQRQHEMSTTSKNLQLHMHLHPPSCTKKKDKSKDNTSKKQLFPPSS